MRSSVRTPAASLRQLCALLACAAAAALGWPAASGAAASTVPVSAMNGWSLHGLSSADLDAQLALMESEGVAEVRIDASWQSIQLAAPGSHGSGYSFGSEDAVVAALARHHIRWLPIIDYSAPWAASIPGDWRSPPASDAQYAAFAAAVAARYGPGGSFWAQNPQLPDEPVQTYEIWNEENATYYWDTGPDPAAYARLYVAARSAIRAVDPQAQVAIGGLTNPQQGMSALAFLDGMFQAVPGLAGEVDAVAIHPYASTASGTVQFVVEVRDLLDSVGAGAAPIEATEFGWQTGSATVEATRAASMAAVAQALGNSNCGIGLLAPYDWMDPSYISGGDWGLAGSDGVRPAGTAWFSGLADAAAGIREQLCPDVAPPAVSPPTTPAPTTATSPSAPSPPAAAAAPTPAPAAERPTSIVPTAAPPATTTAKAKSRARATGKPTKKPAKKKPRDVKKKLRRAKKKLHRTASKPRPKAKKHRAAARRRR